MNKIYVDKSDTEQINKLLFSEPTCEEEGFFDQTITFSTYFPNGYSVDVKLCGVLQYEEGGCNTPWCEAVLFNEKGGECCCTEVSEDIWGLWELEHSGQKYEVLMVPYNENQKEVA